MAEGKVSRMEQGHVKIKNVPIAVTPEGFWCCPSPVGFQKSTKVTSPVDKAKPSSPPDKAAMPKKQTSFREKRPATTPPRSGVLTDDARTPETDAPVVSAPVVQERSPRPRNDHLPRKVSIEFGEPRTSDMKVILVGKQGFCVKLSVHKSVLAEKSSFFAGKIAEENGELPCLQIDDCEDAELYVEVVGLMYCNDMRQRMIKQSVSRALRILKVAETLGFRQCIRTCLQYLEAVPWIGEEEEEKVISSILCLQSEGVGATPVLKRVSSESSSTAVDTLSHVLDLVLKSSEDRGRREMKLVILKLLMENSSLPSYAGSSDICNHTIYGCCKNCLSSLFSSFKQATDPEFGNRSSDTKEPVVRQIALEADNLSWLLEILAERHAADDFAMIWASQDELANLHVQLPTVSRYHVSCITARLFVGIGRGQLLPSKETRLLLMKTWLQPLINDYRWLQHGCRSFDRKVVEEGIGRTILTLPLEDQQSILLSWLGSFLKSGDSCPNLQRAFEVWWRRTFIRPFVDIQPQGQSFHSDRILRKMNDSDQLYKSS